MHMPELNLTKDTICVNETVLDSSTEQSVELDYLLPDYYPNIFKLLKTQIVPKIQSQKVSGNKLYLDGISAVRALYLAEETNRICSIEQTVPFSKTIDLASECNNPVVRVTARCYFVNARAVNQRRLDIRGGISCKIKVTEPRETMAVCGGQGAGLQFHVTPMSVCDGKKYAVKQFTVTDELELGYSKPAFQSMLNYHCTVSPTDYKIIANKVICKGDLMLHILYMPTGDAPFPEPMDFSIPISQIVDVPGVEEDYNCDVNFSVASVTFEPKAAEGEESKILICEFVINVFCTGDRNKEILLADDVYSTLFESAMTSMPVSVERFLLTVNHTAVCKQALDVDSDSSIAGVYDAFCTLSEYTAKVEQGSMRINGMLEATVLCYDNDSMPFAIDKTFPVEIVLDCNPGTEDISFMPVADILNVGYTISSPTQLELRAEVRVSGSIYQKVRCNTISDVTINEESPKDTASSCALRLYYADKDEGVWDIAKRFGTAMTAVMEENALDCERLPEPSMLLIPMVND